MLRASAVLRAEAEALLWLADHLDPAFESVVERIFGCKGRVVCSGIGKTGLVMRKMSATFSSTGTPSFFLHPSEAMHGDLGMLQKEDLLLLASHSGRSPEVLALAQSVRPLDPIALTGDPLSPLSKNCSLTLPIFVSREACPHNLAPTTSTTALMAIGDALAITVLEKRGFEATHFAGLHPGGELGRSLRPVSEVMVMGERRPLVRPDASMLEVVAEISAKGLGIVGVVDEEERLIGCITDGDLRRMLLKNPGMSGTASEYMHPLPQQIAPSCSQKEARNRMHDARITALFVTDAERVVGLVQIHQLGG